MQEAGSKMQEAGSKMQGAGSKMQGAGSKMQGAGSRKQEASSTIFLTVFLEFADSPIRSFVHSLFVDSLIR